MTGYIRPVKGGNMCKRIKITNFRAWASALAIFATVFALSAHAQDVGTALNKCAAISEADARLVCYDALAPVLVGERGESTAAAPAAAPVVAAAAVPAAASVVSADELPAAPAPLTDEVGKERIEPKDADERERFAGRVESCQESVQSGQTYFMFENGQVWKQSNYRRLGYRSCEFDVEISKGALGYDMYIPSKDRSVRVARVK